MSIIPIAPARAKGAGVAQPLVSRDCGPEGCEIDWLASERVEAELDPEDFLRFSIEQGWGDGLPLIPPTEGRVRAFLAANDRYPDEIIGLLPPSNAECTVEKIVVNAVMAGAAAQSLELIIAAIQAVADKDFELYGVNTTTASVFPAFVVNGPVRHDLAIPMGYGCLGGTATQANAIGRAIRLIMRNVGGQVPGESSQTTFGSPARLGGLVVGEWEEKSPWAPLAERRIGAKGNAVTSFGAMGTMNILDTTSQKAGEFLEMIGKSLTYVGNNCYSPAVPFGEVLVGINPVCASIIAETMPDIDDVLECLWHHASVDASFLQALHREQLEAQDRVRADGKVYVTPEPKDLLVFVAGGLGGLHSAAMHSFGTSLAQTRALAELEPASQAAE